MSKKLILVVMTVLAAVAVACSSTEESTPVPTSTPMPTSTAEPTTVPTPSIVDIAVEDGRFTTLVAALQAAGLVDTLSGEGPFTVFAPTDAAFAALPEGTVEALLADIPALTDVLTYHVVAGEVLAADVVALDAANTLQGTDVSVRVEDGSVFISDSQVIITDIIGANGVIHVIDAVLLPGQEEATEPEATPEPTTVPTPSIVDIAVEDGRFTTLVAALQAAGLVDTLSGEGPFTVFAPTDAAFAALPEGTVEALLADIPALTDVLTYHVVAGEVLAADVVALDAANTLQGTDVSVRVEDGSVFINDSQVIITDIIGANGVIHVIDAVLLPGQEEATEPEATPEPTETPEPTIVDITVEDGRFTTLVAALQAAGLVDTLAGEGPFTVFAPTDAAFAALPEGTVEALLADIPALTDVLLYHVVAGEVDAQTALTLHLAPTLQGSNIVVDDQFGAVILNRDGFVLEQDIRTSNGVIHVINRVLLPPATESEEGSEPTIVDIAVEDGRFTTLVAALQAAGLVDTLAGEGPFTVFAPTDAAFAALPEGTVEALLADIPALTEVLLYHVVAGEVLAADVVALDAANTLQGTDVSVRVEDGSVFINDSQVIITDIIGANGVIHVIDAVLLP